MSRQFVKLEVTIWESAMGSEYKTKVLDVSKIIHEDFINNLDENYDVICPAIISKIVSLSRKKSKSNPHPKGKG